MIDLILFENDVQHARNALHYGINRFLVDWEIVDKEERQKGYDTEIRPGTDDDLRALSVVSGAAAWCRINRHGAHTADDVARAIAAGEVEDFLRMIDGRCGAGILVETPDAFAAAGELSNFPLQRVYFGLNDFAICRGGGSIFRAVLDGSVERMREIFSAHTFGFGGMTAIDAGDPLPAMQLLEEMARLDCDFTFLHRSFRRDTQGCDPAAVVAALRSAWQHLRQRHPDIIRHDRDQLEARFRELCR